MNIYLYEGKSTRTATKMVVEGNQQAQIGKEYAVDINSGMLMIAYPTDPDSTNQPVSFDFSYFVGYPK